MTNDAEKINKNAKIGSEAFICIKLLDMKALGQDISLMSILTNFKPQGNIIQIKLHKLFEKKGISDTFRRKKKRSRFLLIG